jgi:tripartite-type tricarboxylate transporter receptor subunit TctC
MWPFWGGAPVVFVVNISMPRSLKTVAIASKASPGKYNYGSPGSGTLLHVAMERLKQVTGAQITHIPYKGAAPALQDMMGGNIEMTVDTLGLRLAPASGRPGAHRGRRFGQTRTDRSRHPHRR